MCKNSCLKHYLPSLLLLSALQVHASGWGIKTFAQQHDVEQIVGHSLPAAENYALAQNTQGQLVLLRGGVQVESLDSAAIQRFRDYDPKFNFSQDLGDSTGVQSKSPTLLQMWSATPLRELGQWPTGMSVAAGISLQSSKIIGEKDYQSLDWTAKLKPDLWVSLGVETKTERGSFARTVIARDSTQFSDWSFRLGIGVPWLRYELRQASNALPEFYFMEPDAKADLELADSYLLQIPKNAMDLPADYGSNYLHLVEAKLGYAHFKYWMDADQYTNDCWQLLIQDLPMGRSKWWLGWTQAGKLWAPGFGADFFNIRLGSYHLKSAKINPELGLFVNTWWRGPLNNAIEVGLKLNLPEFMGER